VPRTVRTGSGLVERVGKIFAERKEGGELKGGDASRPPFLWLATPLRCFVGLGFEGLLAANIDLDLLGLGFRLFGQADLQHALGKLGRA
jgi:hypothetical protein